MKREKQNHEPKRARTHGKNLKNGVVHIQMLAELFFVGYFMLIKIRIPTAEIVNDLRGNEKIVFSGKF